MLAADDGGLGDAAKACDPAGTLARAFPVADFSGKFGSVVEVFAPEGTALDRLVAVGAGKASSLDDYAWLKLGGSIAASLRKAAEVAVVLDVAGRPGRRQASGERRRRHSSAQLCLRQVQDEEGQGRRPSRRSRSKVTIHCADPAAAKKAFADEVAVIDGVLLARDLVNEPANALGPVEFAARAKELEALGVRSRS